MTAAKPDSPVSQTEPSAFVKPRTEQDAEDYHARDGSSTSLVSSRPHAQLEEDAVDEGTKDEGRSSREGERCALQHHSPSNPESASRPLVGFGVLNDNLIKCLISFVEVHEQILSNRYKGIHGYITQSTIMMQMEPCDQCV
jgi:hypothetical protein